MITRLIETFRQFLPGNSLQEQDYLLFNLPPGSGVTVDPIPKYLFRVVSPHSGGETSRKWVRSVAARNGRVLSRTDIFDNWHHTGRHQHAEILDAHLMGEHTETNFVSWTSSLLCALQLIYYRNFHNDDRSKFRDILLFVVDTTLFPQGVFIRDRALIAALPKVDGGTRSVGGLSGLPEEGHDVGEYLSQGSLKIEDKCQIISAQSLIDNGLTRIQRDLYCLCGNSENPRLATDVEYLRLILWPPVTIKVGGFPQRQVNREDLDGSLEAICLIVNKFDPEWRLPMTLYFAALIGPIVEDSDLDHVISKALRDGFPLARKPFHFQIVAPDTMPEMRRVQALLRAFNDDGLGRTSVQHTHSPCDSQTLSQSSETVDTSQ